MTRKKLLTLAAMTFGLVAVGAQNGAAQEMASTESVEFQAQVVDLSCKLVYNLSGDMHRECAQVCADRGVTLGLLAEDGTFYLPVSQAMPGAGSNEMLRPHAEHTVKVKGKRINRAGMNSIIIESVAM